VATKFGSSPAASAQARMELPQYCISGENTAEMAPVYGGFNPEEVACDPPTWFWPEAASVEVAPDPNQENASTNPMQITTKGGTRNPDRQPPCEEKAAVWSEEREACLEGMAPGIYQELRGLSTYSASRAGLALIDRFW
jgi:hypothetical protein